MFPLRYYARRFAIKNFNGSLLQLAPAMTWCSRCGRTGHNKRSCPSKKRKAPAGGGAGEDGRPARGGKRKRPRGTTSAAGLHDPFRAAREELARAEAAGAAAAKHKTRTDAQADTDYEQDMARAKATLEATRKQAKAASARVVMTAKQRIADARAALARAQAEADPGDLPCFPAAVRNGRRFPWSIALQFAAARDLATLAATHRAARDVCRHEQTAKRVLKARHGRGCKRAKDTKCKCPGCARVALLLRAADTLGGEGCGDGAPSRWLRVLDYLSLIHI